MNPSDLTRRKAIFALSATALSATALSAALCPLALPARAAQTEGAIHILKDPGCGCCTAWATILDRAGFQVTTEPVAGTALMRMKADHGIPAALASCHTALIDGYAIEGHVPVADIRRLLAERPDAVGLAVPGIPYGSPGMGPEEDREAFDVHLIRRDGSTGIFASYPAA